jgi:phosphoesterase RecJ-like protein
MKQMEADHVNAFTQLLNAAERILIIQADNPDADSLSSALALEALLAEQAKEVFLYCGVDMPDYLKYLEGWSRVDKRIPSNFDLSIIVDASASALLEKATETGVLKQAAVKPCVVLDHHSETANDITFASLVINKPEMSSTCELIHTIATELEWNLPLDACTYIVNGILGDTQGLSNQLAKPPTYRLVADLIELGVNRPQLEENRRAQSKMPESIYRFKAKLIQQTEFAADGRIAYVMVSQEEINKYSPLYNPGPLIQTDMLQVAGVLLGIVFKVYDRGSVTAMIRANNGAEIADKLAVHFGGGGHAYASGFKATDGRSFKEIKSECLAKAIELLDKSA